MLLKGRFWAGSLLVINTQGLALAITEIWGKFGVAYPAWRRWCDYPGLLRSSYFCCCCLKWHFRNLSGNRKVVSGLKSGDALLSQLTFPRTEVEQHLWNGGSQPWGGTGAVPAVSKEPWSPAHAFLTVRDARHSAQECSAITAQAALEVSSYLFSSPKLFSFPS